jgi:hypothetical protein
MKAAVPYMAALTGAPRGGAALQPPRRLFGSDAHIDSNAEDQLHSRAAPLPEGATSATGRTPTAPPGLADSRSAATHTPAPGSRGTPATKPEMTPATEPPVGSEHPPARRRSPEPASLTPSPRSAPHAADARRGPGVPPERLPTSFTDPLWDEPVVLPSRTPAPDARRVGEERPAAGEPDALRIEPARPAPATATPTTVTLTRGTPAQPQVIARPGAPEAARPVATIGPASPLRSEEPPQSAPAVPEPAGPAPAVAVPADPAVPGSAAPPAVGFAPPNPGSRGDDPAGQWRAPQHLRSAQPETVSIGTIEVTVVPPAKPRAVPSRPAPRRERPPSRLGGADPLRDGRRRWYGTAQG